MKQASLRIYIGATLLTLMFFSILLFIDGVSSSLNIFGELSNAFAQGMLNLFGKFPLLIISIGVYLGFMIFIVMESLAKLFSSIGYSMLMLFFPPFFQTVNRNGFKGGYYGRAVSSIFEGAGLTISILIYFFWFLTALFLLLYPFRELMVRLVLKLMNRLVPGIELDGETESAAKAPVKGEGQNGLFARTIDMVREQVNELSKKSGPPKERASEKRAVKNRIEDRERPIKKREPKRASLKSANINSRSIPLLSKVVYESPSNRVEIPIFPAGHNVKKFKLSEKNVSKEGESKEVEAYEEVDTFSGGSPNLVYDEINKQKSDYYDRVKRNWPESWKDDVEGIKSEGHLTREELGKTELPEVIESVSAAPSIVDPFVEEPEELSARLEEAGENQDYILVNEVEVKPLYDEKAAQLEFSEIECEDEVSTETPNMIENKIKSTFDKVDGQYRVELSPDELEALLSVDNDEYSEEEDYFTIEDEDEPPFSNINFNETMPEKGMFKESDKVPDNESIKAEEEEAARILEATLMEFGIKAEVVDTIHGPVVTLFKLIPAPGIKLSKIEGLSNNLALRLGAKSIRIIAPIPGEKVVGIEIPNNKRELVSFSEVVNSPEFTESKFQVPIGLGKDIYGKIVVIDLYKMPHILIAGATGAGKSVCVNGFLSSILFSCSPEDVRLILIDPKIVELKPYNDIPHLFTPVITDSKEAIIALKYLVFEMERRYSLLDQMGVRDIVEYNRCRESKSPHLEKLPFVVAVVDEFADLMSTAGKEPEMLFARLTAKARAIGIHLVLATQRPSTDVITGLIKANVPARIAFQVISLQDSRIILDQKGAEKLLGQGDMLYLSPTQPFPIRLQGAYLGKEEVDAIAEHWKGIAEPSYVDIKEVLGENEEDDEGHDGAHSSRDPLFDEAVEIIMQTNKASASYLQRRLNIGYNRAARLVEEMEAGGIVGPANGSKPREVLIDYYQG